MLKTDWNDDAQIAIYYRGLKKEIKDDITKQERLISLKKMSNLAIRINQRLYKRRLERKRKYRHAPKKHDRPRKNYYKLRPIKLDIIYKPRKYVKSGKNIR